MKKEQILFGAAYYAEYLDEDRTDRDFSMMRRAGINTIRIAESTWSTWEPRDGEFDFTVLRRVLAAANRHGLNVIVGTPTYAIPPWMAKKYPDILAVTHRGPERYGHRQNMDITHPDYLRHAERIIRRLMEETAHDPSVIGIQLDNETKSYDTSGERVQKRFVEYLKERFGTTEALNARFGLAYWSNAVHDWEDFPDVRGTINGSLAAEFCKFQRSLVTDFLNWQAEIVREYLRPDQFITQNFDFGWKGHSFGIQPDVDHFRAAGAVTIAGADIYHPSQDRLTGKEAAFCGAVARAISRACAEPKENYLILETEAQGLLTWLPYPGQLRLQAFSHLSSGSDSVMYWHWHSIHNAIESYWKGILSHNLKENETYREISGIGNDLARIGGHLLHLKKNCRAALLVSNESLTGMDIFDVSREFHYNDAVRWLFDALYENNVECDVLPADSDALSEYSLVLVPALYSVDDATLLRLKRYVKEGGHLIATFKTGFSDEYLKIRTDDQPGLLSECFGITYDQFTRPEQVFLRWETVETGDALPQGRTSVTEWMELLVPTTAEVLAGYDHPFWNRYAAVTKQCHGEGWAVYLGCYFDADALRGLMRRLLPEAGIPLPDVSFPLIRKTGTNAYGRTIRYLLNYSGAPLSFPYSGSRCTELLSGADVTDGQTLTLPAWGVLILEEAGSKL